MCSSGVQGKKRGKRRAKATAAQQKIIGERKPVASDKAVKDVGVDIYIHTTTYTCYCSYTLSYYRTLLSLSDSGRVVC